ncbi:hypothetical protein KC19_7G097700 [Ceratodon purpureus]|uniref:Secreted protein n=1 Tax=Ceratodon purpureus TaxID=3225 RepID=A0A8T0H4J8_CERPU|nr:hypothetical protein KC19_7G097700 [Ceratodon purpureus]
MESASCRHTHGSCLLQLLLASERCCWCWERSGVHPWQPMIQAKQAKASKGGSLGGDGTLPARSPGGWAVAQ